MSRCISDAGFVPNIVQETDVFFTALNLVRAGLGISIAPSAVQFRRDSETASGGSRLAPRLAPVLALLGILSLKTAPNRFASLRATVLNGVVSVHSMRSYAKALDGFTDPKARVCSPRPEITSQIKYGHNRPPLALWLSKPSGNAWSS